jgi:hypothetical protein
MTAHSCPDHRVLAEALRLRVLEGPGITDRAIRQAAAERATGGPTMEAPYNDLACQIGGSAVGVTDEQVARVLRVTGNQKATFEIIAAAALAAGLVRWKKRSRL